MKLARLTIVGLLVQLVAFNVVAKVNYISKDAVTDFGLSLSTDEGSDAEHCQNAFVNILYSSKDSNAVFYFFTPELKAYDEGGSDYTKTSRYCSYKLKLKHDAGWKVQIKNPYFKVKSSTQLSPSVGVVPVPVAKMDFSFAAKTVINSLLFFDNALWMSGSMGPAKLGPHSYAPLKSLWTKCGDTEIDIEFEMKAHAEKISTGDGIAQGSMDRAVLQMEWQKCPSI